ncbi:UDP-2,4-diacetamido-2,4,6-trideoxy-beta-L-altropyranose hydrolase [Motilimonas sp. KMU-193]|uniref:UDP-2,4-diacetamido-2,4, 6-trideoxy-beta-L-altropyranose hydrolase n=1 Tax=Motilimonas sp. KMU-193 TaxID=3388668 RepID=UPI00396B470E
MNCLFRVDASNEIGFGHLMRCLTLAKQLAKYQIESHFYCKQSDSFDTNMLSNAGFTVHLIQEGDQLDERQDALNTLALIKRITPIWVILDNYQLGSIWQAALGSELPAINCKLLVIDDLCRPIAYADLLLDQSLGRQQQDYTSSVKGCDFAVGINYALLREQFLQRVASAKQKRKSLTSRHLLVSIGATDPLQLTLKVLASLNQLPASLFPKVTVILSRHAPHYQQVDQLITSQKLRNISLLSEVEEMAEYMLQADFAIGACGTSSWERACLGLPSICFVVADNQRYLSKALMQYGLCYIADAGITAQALTSQIQQVANSPERLMMSQHGFELVDGKGTQRLAIMMLKQSAPGLVSLRPFCSADMEVVYQWQQVPEIRQFARTPRAPSWEEHQAWFKNMLENQDNNYIIEWNRQACGVIRLSATAQPSQWEVSILVALDFHGLGVASKALAALQTKHNVTMIAEISPNNQASIRLFTRAGFTQTSSRIYQYNGADKHV